MISRIQHDFAHLFRLLTLHHQQKTRTRNKRLFPFLRLASSSITLHVIAVTDYGICSLFYLKFGHVSCSLIHCLQQEVRHMYVTARSRLSSINNRLLQTISLKCRRPCLCDCYLDWFGVKIFCGCVSLMVYTSNTFVRVKRWRKAREIRRKDMKELRTTVSAVPSLRQ